MSISNLLPEMMLFEARSDVEATPLLHIEPAETKQYYSLLPFDVAVCTISIPSLHASATCQLTDSVQHDRNIRKQITFGPSSASPSSFVVDLEATLSANCRCSLTFFSQFWIYNFLDFNLMLADTAAEHPGADSVSTILPRASSISTSRSFSSPPPVSSSSPVVPHTQDASDRSLNSCHPVIFGFPSAAASRDAFLRFIDEHDKTQPSPAIPMDSVGAGRISLQGVHGELKTVGITVSSSPSFPFAHERTKVIEIVPNLIIVNNFENTIIELKQAQTEDIFVFGPRSSHPFFFPSASAPESLVFRLAAGSSSASMRDKWFGLVLMHSQCCNSIFCFLLCPGGGLPPFLSRQSGRL